MAAVSAPSPSASRPPPGRRWRPRLAAGLLAGAVLLTYANTLTVPLLLDDQSAIAENPTLTDLTNLGAVLAPARTTTSGRPLLNLSFALNYAWSGPAVAGYHAVNLAIHVGAALLLLGVVRRTLRSPGCVGRYGAVARPLGVFVALLWAVHPLLTGAVTYLSQRAESLMGLCYLLTLYGFIRSVDSPRPARWAAMSAAGCWLGMMTKEVMLTAPVLVLLYDRAFWAPSLRAAWSRRRWYYVALALSWALLAYLMVSSRLGERDVGLRAGPDWVHYALTEFKGVVWYARLALWPDPLVFDYGPEILVREFAPVAGYALGVLAALAGTGWLWWRGRTGLGFVAAAYFLLLAPTSSFLPIMGQPLAESRMYLPLAAVIVLGVLGLQAVLPRAVWLVLGALAMGLCLLSVRRNQDYRSALVLWEDTIRKQPENSRGQYNLANELAQQPGRSAEAIAHYEAALRLQPDLTAAHHNLANELAQQPGRSAEAIAHYEAALRLQPDLVSAHTQVARLLALLPERLPDAVAHYEQAVALQPESAEWHFHLANLLARLPGRLPEAFAQYEAALRLQPDFVAAHYNYANKLANVPGRLPEALGHYEAVLRLDPRRPEAHKNFALALANLGRVDEAVRQLEAALALRPEYREAQELLGPVRAARDR